MTKKILTPHIYRPQPVPRVLQTKKATRKRPVVQPKMKAPRIVTPVNSRAIQRNCGAPGCVDPTCNDPSNHGFENVRVMRGRVNYSGDVSPADVGGGSGTSQGSRNYVNDPATPYPQQVAIEYASNQGGGHSEFINQPLAPGQRADAGHIFGRQYGGIGNQNAAVFPQHPQTNRGNYYQGEPTRDLWRAHEDQVRGMAQSGAVTSVSVTLRDAPRISYEHACRYCHLIYVPGALFCGGCGRPVPN